MESLFKLCIRWAITCKHPAERLYLRRASGIKIELEEHREKKSGHYHERHLCRGGRALCRVERLKRQHTTPIAVDLVGHLPACLQQVAQDRPVSRWQYGEARPPGVLGEEVVLHLELHGCVGAIEHKRECWNLDVGKLMREEAHAVEVACSSFYRGVHRSHALRRYMIMFVVI